MTEAYAVSVAGRPAGTLAFDRSAMFHCRWKWRRTDGAEEVFGHRNDAVEQIAWCYRIDRAAVQLARVEGVAA